MWMRSVALWLTVVAASLLAAAPAGAIGFVLGQTKEELRLEYDLKVHDHGTGRVTVVFTLTDEGRLAPLDEVQLTIPAEEKNEDGSHWMDLVVSFDMARAENGKRVGRVHIRKEWAERAEIRLNTHTLDGKMDPLTRLHHVIRVVEHMKDAPPEAAKPAPIPSTDQPAIVPAASDR